MAGGRWHRRALTRLDCGPGARYRPSVPGSCVLLVAIAAAAPSLGTYRPTPAAAAATLDDLDHPDGPTLAGGLWWDTAEGAWATRDTAPSARRGTGTLALAVDLGRGLRFEGALPVVLGRLGDEGGQSPERLPTALGPAGLRGRWTGHAGGWRIGVAARVEAPGSEVVGATWNAGPELALARVEPWGRVGGQAAWLAGLWDARVGLELRPVATAALFGELQIAGPDSGPLGAELRGGLRGDLTPAVRAEAGLGVGLVRVPGTPEYRVSAGIVVHAPVMRHRHPDAAPNTPPALPAATPILLDYDAGVLSPASLARLDAIGASLRATPEARVRIEARVNELRLDASGVAWMRAALVRQLLVDRGASVDQVEIHGEAAPGKDQMSIVEIYQRGI